MAEELERRDRNIIDEIELIEEVGQLRNRGYNFTEIAGIKKITPVKAKKLFGDYITLLNDQIQRDPDFLDRVKENTLATLKQFDDLNKEIWETVEVATDNGMLGERSKALKLAMDLLDKKAKILQLVGGSNDSGLMYRVNKAEAVNLMLSSVIKEVIAGCDRCAPEARHRLAEAFATMGAAEEAMNADNVQDAEVIEDEGA